MREIIAGNKRFRVANWAILCVSLVFGGALFKGSADQIEVIVKTYQICIWIIVGGFFGFQTFTDHKKLTNETTGQAKTL